jgi:endo-1,3(4)-beta-glucanase
MNFELTRYQHKDGYQRIPDVEDQEGNTEEAPKSISAQALSYNRWIFPGLFLISLLLLAIAVGVSYSPALLEQPYLLKSTPYKVGMHPDPPTSYWGVVTKPYPTGAFWTNLVVKNGDGAVGIYPYGIKTLDAGVQVSYGAFRRQVSSNAITDIFMVDLQISATQAYASRSIESYDNVSVTMAYKTQPSGSTGNGNSNNKGNYKGVFVKGSPFVTVVFDGATPIISSPVMRITSVESKLLQDHSGTQYIVTLGNFQKWLVYCSESVVLNWKDTGLSAATPIHGFVRVAILPNQNADNAFSTYLNYVQRYPTGGSVSLSYPTPNQGLMTIQYNTVGSGSLLMFALPHHIPLLPTSLLNNDESIRVQQVLTPIWCTKGKLKALVGDIWKLTYNLASAPWNYALQDKLTNSQLDNIAKYLIQEVKSSPPAAADVYSFAKQLGRMTRLALIADNLGIADARQLAIQFLETSLIPWLQGMNTDILLYDKIYGGLVTTQSLTDAFSNFGAGWYSDHHFHYGYFAHAVAALVKLDVNFYEANKAALDSFIRDFCNPDPTDLDFPVARHKDFFDGHSWASGLFQQSNGKGQESSSEVKIPFFSILCFLSILK